ncbi:hypothetical protein OAG73_01220 [bacterium]|nr:hypothetical protein [bacterium]
MKLIHRIMANEEAFHLVLAPVVATMVSRFWFGIEPWYVLPESIDFGQAARFSQIGWFGRGYLNWSV